MHAPADHTGTVGALLCGCNIFFGQSCSRHVPDGLLMHPTRRTILVAYAVMTAGKVQFTYIVGSDTSQTRMHIRKTARDGRVATRAALPLEHATHDPAHRFSTFHAGTYSRPYISDSR